MKQTIIAAAIIAFGLVLAAYISTSRYEIVRVADDAVVRLDRLTGTTAYCRLWENNAPACLTMPEMKHDGKTAIGAANTNQN